MLVFVYGGLGNQLFQVNFAYYLWKLYQGKHKVKLILISPLAKEIDENSLLEFGLVVRKSLALTFIARLGFKFPRVFSRILSTDATINGRSVFSWFYTGYWQNVSYTDKEFSRKIIKNFEDSCNARSRNCVIQVRGGDYLLESNSRIYFKCTYDYYLNAFQLLKDRCLNFKCIDVVSNDFNYSRALIVDLIVLNGDRFILEFNHCFEDDVSDFYRMCNATILIGANSTFSWWAGYLGKATIVIHPLVWSVYDDIRQCNFKHDRAYLI